MSVERCSSCAEARFSRYVFAGVDGFIGGFHIEALDGFGSAQGMR
jgi:hypothetical protein